jgi:hypothetical protein
MKYEQGKKYRVIKEGARLSGMRPVAPYVQQGWGLTLPVGMVITCEGMSMTRGDGVLALKWSDAQGQYLASDCLFSPVKGDIIWGGQLPADGFLEEVAEGRE